MYVDCMGKVIVAVNPFFLGTCVRLLSSKFCRRKRGFSCLHIAWFGCFYTERLNNSRDSVSYFSIFDRSFGCLVRLTTGGAASFDEKLGDLKVKCGPTTSSRRNTRRCLSSRGTHRCATLEFTRVVVVVASLHSHQFVPRAVSVLRGSRQLSGERLLSYYIQIDDPPPPRARAPSAVVLKAAFNVRLWTFYSIANQIRWTRTHTTKTVVAIVFCVC